MIGNFVQGLLPWWGWAIIAALIVLAVWRLLGTRIALAVLGVLSLFVAHSKGRDEGEAVQKERQKRIRDREVKKAQEIEDRVKARDPDRNREELRKWGPRNPNGPPPPA